MSADPESNFGVLLREWRSRRRVSQLDLAVEAGVSSRHVSFIETGRAQPSREMILMLARVLDVPLRDRNDLLTAAGYAAMYRASFASLCHCRCLMYPASKSTVSPSWGRSTEMRA